MVVTMYIILVYDIGEKRVAKALKICRIYLNWVQNSVFEGDLSDAKLQALKLRLKKMMKPKEDSVLIYCLRNRDVYKKQVLGVEKNAADSFL